MYNYCVLSPMLLAREWTALDGMLLAGVILVLIVALLYFLNRAAYKKMDEQQALIDSTKMSATIYVIDKKRDKLKNISLPKAAQAQIPAYAKMMKLYFVKAKIGPQIVTLMCDKNVFNAVPLKKNIKAQISGMYLVDFVGLKSADEMKKKRKEKKEKQKKEK
ncbi:MAG: hypothetical protein IKS17_00105 [Firmicutes bacterium]|nr:hypothetical protein [Bacillota bacterium]